MEETFEISFEDLMAEKPYSCSHSNCYSVSLSKESLIQDLEKAQALYMKTSNSDQLLPNTYSLGLTEDFTLYEAFHIAADLSYYKMHDTFPDKIGLLNPERRRLQPQAPKSKNPMLNK